MNWDAISAVGESIGAIAVCVTLIFLTFQLRQSNKAQRTAAYQTYINARTALQASLLQPEVNRALLDGSFDPLGCSEQELERYHHVLHLCMTYFSSAFRLWKDGLLSDEEWAADLSMVTEFKGTEGFRLWWPEVNNFYTAEFVSAVDEATLLATGLERFIARVDNLKRAPEGSPAPVRAGGGDE